MHACGARARVVKALDPRSRDLGFEERLINGLLIDANDDGVILQH